MSEKSFNNNGIPQETSEDAVREITAANLKQLISDKGISQKKLAEMTDYAPASITDYLSGKRIPPVHFFIKLKNLYGISLDDFITKSIQPSIPPGAQPATNSGSSWLSSGSAGHTDFKEAFGQFPRDTCRKYCGSYYLYYFDTSKYRGRDTLPPAVSLHYGIMYIYENPSALDVPEYSCAAVLGMTDAEKAADLKKEIDSFPDPASVVQYIGSSHAYTAYYGRFDLGQEHAFISLQHTNTDRALIILHRVDNNKANYLGGIGTINSISKGRERMPVLQFIGFSRIPLAQSPEEIEFNLLLRQVSPPLLIKEETEELIRIFKMLYLENTKVCEALSDLQKTIFIQSTLERAIQKNMKRNLFRYSKISERDDDAWYHAIKYAVEHASKEPSAASAEPSAASGQTAAESAEASAATTE